MRNPIHIALLGGICSITFSCDQAPEPKEEKPNFVFIFADDLGYGDIGCFGATDIKTPHIDRMAKEGIQFTEFYSASPVSSPSRAALMTGRYPQRMGINSVFFPESFTGMPPSEITIAEALEEEGYISGLIGKWHLGHRKKFLPLQQGFDEYFGIPYSNDMESVVYMRGNKVVDFHVDQHYITQTYTEESLNFIDKHKDQPFFLYVAHNMPHVPIYASEKFRGTSNRGLYGDVIQELDWSVGQILEKLKEHQLLENTLIVFSSDNGPWTVMEERGGSPGCLRGSKMYTFEGGQRVPTVAMWKETINSGRVYENMANMMDWFPTFVSLAGAEIPEDRFIDGVDISNVLYGKGDRKGDEFLYFMGEDYRAYRSGKWKIKQPYEGFEGARWKVAMPPHPTLLFNLQQDSCEQNNLADSLPQKTQEMHKQMQEARKSLGDLPPSLVVRTSADHQHYKYLEEKNNPNH